MPPRSIAILGGGVSGLTAAFALRSQLKQKSKDIITVYEASSRVGGWIESKRDPQTKALCEAGPRSLRTTGVAAMATIELAYELNIHDRAVAAKNHPGVKNRFVYLDGRLVSIPMSLRGFLSLSNPITKALWNGIIRDAFTARDLEQDMQDETIHAFIARRLGPAVADLVIDPMCRGIYAGDARELSLPALMPPVEQARRSHGSLVRATVAGMFGRGNAPADGVDGAKAAKEEEVDLADVDMSETMSSNILSMLEKAAFVTAVRDGSIWSFEDGMGTLVEALKVNLESLGVNIKYNAAVTSLRPNGAGVEIKLSDGSTATADRVISALPAHNLATCFVVTGSDPSSALSYEIAGTLAQIPAVSVGVVNFAFAKQVLQRVGFGYLVPSWVKSNALGVVWDSCVFPQQEMDGGPGSRLTVMMGGHQFEKLFGNPKAFRAADLIPIAKDTLREQMGINDEPIHTDARVCVNCISQYTLGHKDRVARIRDLTRQMFGEGVVEIIGASFDGVGVNDCVHHAKLAGGRVAKST